MWKWQQLKQFSYAFIHFITIPGPRREISTVVSPQSRVRFKSISTLLKIEICFWRVILAETSWSLEIVASVDQNALQPQGMLAFVMLSLFTQPQAYMLVYEFFFIQYRFVVLLKSIVRFSSNSICVHIHWALHPLHHRQFSVTSLITHPSACTCVRI